MILYSSKDLIALTQRKEVNASITNGPNNGLATQDLQLINLFVNELQSSFMPLTVDTPYTIAERVVSVLKQAGKDSYQIMLIIRVLMLFYRNYKDNIDSIVRNLNSNVDIPPEFSRIACKYLPEYFKSDKDLKEESKSGGKQIDQILPKQDWKTFCKENGMVFIKCLKILRPKNSKDDHALNLAKMQSEFKL